MEKGREGGRMHVCSEQTAGDGSMGEMLTVGDVGTEFADSFCTTLIVLPKV